MDSDPLATALGRWADGLAPAARDQLSTYDLRALYDRLSRTGSDDGGLAAFDGWMAELGPTTQAMLSRYDRAALMQLLASTGRPLARSLVPSGANEALSPLRCTDCHSTRLVRTGTCYTCQDCGTTTGCG